MPKEPKLIANLGDQGDPITYGACFLYEVDGKHHAECWMGTEVENDKNELYRFDVERNAIEDLDWLDDGDIRSMASGLGIPEMELKRIAASGDVEERTWFYKFVGEHFGFVELDHDPEVLTEKELSERFEKDFREFAVRHRGA